MAGLNVHVYPSPMTHETRIMKITRSLVKRGIFRRVIIVGRSEDDLPDVEDLRDGRMVLRIRSRIPGKTSNVLLKAFRTIEWALRILVALRSEQIACINCHSLPVLPLCVVLKWIKRADLIYDTHELETEVGGSRGIVRVLLKFTERFLIRFADETIVVNESIASWYKRTYDLDRVTVVRNVPHVASSAPDRTKLLREPFNLSDEDMVFLYQGVLAKGRGIELLLNAFANLGQRKHIVFMGYGPLVEVIQDYGRAYPNIHYHQAVSPETLLKYTASADVGVSIIENLCLSYRLCLPNKLFEYLNAGLPVIVSDLPEMARQVRNHKCGWITPLDVTRIQSLVRGIVPEDVAIKRDNVEHMRGSYGWHIEEDSMYAVYQRLGYVS